MRKLVPWFGGKSGLAKKIVGLIPKHTCYVEVFMGGGSVFFEKQPSKVEVINDINKDLINVYRVVRNHYEEFIRCLDFYLVSREEFERLKNDRPESLTDIQRAVRFFYLIKNCFSVKLNGLSFGYRKTSQPRLNLETHESLIRFSYDRLKKAYIECLPFEEIFSRYDSENTFFYVDPPYFNHEKDYGKDVFSRESFNALSEILKKMKGKFILSINATDETQDLFGCFNCKKVETTYCAGKGPAKKVEEALYANFSLV